MNWWRRENGSTRKLLGHLTDCMQALAQHCLESVKGAPRKTTLRVLSLSDGCVDDLRQVPSSVLLARALASLDDDVFPRRLQQIEIFGADIENPRYKQIDSLQKAEWVPPWLQLRHVRLDNETDFHTQITEFAGGSSRDPRKEEEVV